MMRTVFLGIGLLTGVMSCGMEKMHSVVGDQLTVYFEDKKDQALAESIALFWLEHDLVTGDPQDIQLTYREHRYTVGIIAKEHEKIERLSFAERKLLSRLMEELQEEVFDEKSVTITICNTTFDVLYEIN